MDEIILCIYNKSYDEMDKILKDKNMEEILKDKNYFKYHLKNNNQRNLYAMHFTLLYLMANEILFS